MNILYITHNTSLRSTTCVLDAVITQLTPNGLNPVFVFPEAGPWPEDLKKKGHHCYYHNFAIPDKKKVLQFLSYLTFWYRLLKKESINIIHCNEHENFLMVRLAAKLLKIPVVVGVRFVVEKGFCHWAFRDGYTPAKLLFTSSDQLQRCRSALPNNIKKDNISLLGNGRNLQELINVNDRRETTRMSWSASSNIVVIGTASVIRPRKLLEDFIYLIKELVQAGRPVMGVIAGGGKYADPDYYQMLEALIITHDLSEHVKMLGNLEKMSPFYQGIDLFVSTSELETFGMSVCEAMAFSKPVVGYTGGSVAEVIGDPWCVVDIGDKQSLIEKITFLLNNPLVVEELAAKNKKRAFENFDAPVLANRIEKIYDEITR